MAARVTLLVYDANSTKALISTYAPATQPTSTLTQ